MPKYNRCDMIYTPFQLQSFFFFFKSSYFILHMKGDSFSPVQLKAQKRLAYYVKESFFKKLFFFPW